MDLSQNGSVYNADKMAEALWVDMRLDGSHTPCMRGRLVPGVCEHTHGPTYACRFVVGRCGSPAPLATGIIPRRGFSNSRPTTLLPATRILLRPHRYALFSPTERPNLA